VLASLVDRWRGLGLLNLATVKTLLVARAHAFPALLSIDTLKTCVVVDALTRSRHRFESRVGRPGRRQHHVCVGGWHAWGRTMGATLVNVGSGRNIALVGVFEACSRWWYFWY